jgi:hypothetical protein
MTTSEQIKEILGYEVLTEVLPNGKHIAMWMAFDRPPPPTSHSAEGALQGLLDMLLRLKISKDSIFEKDEPKKEQQNGTQPEHS